MRRPVAAGLTVPTSGADPGRAARPVAIPAGGGAQAAAQLGQVLLDVGTAVENDRLDRQYQRAQIEAMRGLNDLRLKAEAIGDPDAAEKAWVDGVASLRASFDAPGPDGRPGLDPQNSDRFGLTFDALANRHAFSLGRRTLAARNAQRQANFIDYSHTAAQTYATGDAEMRAATLSDLDAMVADDLTAGRIDAAEAERRKLAFRADGDNARVIRLLSEDPAAYLAARGKGDFTGLSAETLARYDAQATAAQRRRKKAEQDAAQKAEQDRQRALSGRLAEIRSIAATGQSATDESLLNNPEVKKLPDYAQTMAALALRDEGTLIDQMSPTDLRAAITAEQATPKAHKWQTERLGLLEQALSRAEAGYAKDPVGYAQQTGRDVPAWQGFDPAQPGDLALSLNVRQAWARSEVAGGYTDAPVMLSAAEQAQLRAAADPEADTSSRLALMTGLIGGLDGDGGAALARQIAPDPVFPWATGLMARGAPTATISAALAGQSALAKKTAIAPSHNDALTLFNKITDGQFSDQNDTADAVLQSAIAIYAGENPVAKSGEIDESAFASAVQRALGASPNHDGDLVIGGLQEIGDALVPLPVNVPAQSVEDGLGKIADSLVPDFKITTVGSTQRPVDTSLLTQVSPLGQMPDFGDPSADGYAPAGVFDALHLEALWPGGKPTDSYVLRRPGKPARYLRDVNGAPFVISLKRLLEATR